MTLVFLSIRIAMSESSFVNCLGSRDGWCYRSHPWRCIPARTSMSGRSPRCDCPQDSRSGSPLLTGEALTDDPGILVNKNRHGYLAAATTFSAASARSLAGVILSPLSLSLALPSSTLVPSRRAMMGISTPTCVTA